MIRPSTGARVAVVLSALAVLALGGCPAPPDFEDTLNVTLPGNRQTTAAEGSGIASLANSVWAFHKSADDREFADQPGPYGGTLGSELFETPEPDALMFRAEFDDQGRLLRIFDNQFLAPELLGDEFVYDGEVQNSTLPGLRYAASSYAAQDGAQIGVAVPYEVWFFGIPAGSATAYAWGTIEGDRLTGIAGYVLDPVDLEGIFGDSAAVQYTVYGLREE